MLVQWSHLDSHTHYYEVSTRWKTEPRMTIRKGLDIYIESATGQKV